MLLIYKYEIIVSDFQTILMPDKAEILKVGVIDEKVFIWTLVDTNKKLVEYNFRVFGTGQPIDNINDPLKYIGSFFLYEGKFVGHLFHVLK